MIIFFLINMILSLEQRQKKENHKTRLRVDKQILILLNS